MTRPLEIKDVQSGDVLDAEFLRGETTTPKSSEQFEDIYAH